MAVPNAELHPLWTMRKVTTESGCDHYWAQEPSLVRLIVSYGYVTTQDPAAVQAKVDASLDG